jgi:BirA family biotin operon repressor/biotin-[acetyl-CoA-carboxylase] ligase
MAGARIVINTRQKLLRHMADLGFHSGESLGDALGLSRAAVWKQIQALQEEGIEFETIHGRGYRLITPVEPLDAQLIRRELSPEHADSIEITVLNEVDSTNAYLLTVATDRPRRVHVCFAERQSAGRGRRGRRWQSPYGTSLAMSLLWRVDAGAAALAGLSLATGVAVAEALEKLGASGLKLKWPNDLVYRKTEEANSHDAKVGGILIEVSGDAAGPCYAVIGLGLNIAAPVGHKDMSRIEQDWINLSELMPSGQAVFRNHIGAAIITALMDMLPRFEKEGFACAVEGFRCRDALYGREITVLRGEQTVNGIAAGIADDGCLLFETGGQRQVLMSGEVSVRAVE